jgi:hypothetical protein
MDIGGVQILETIASSTSTYFEVYSPIFLLVGGVVLAMGIIGVLVDIADNQNVI